VYDLTNGQTIYSDEADTSLPLASLTKIITLYAASQTLSPDSPVLMTQSALAQSGDYGDYGFTPGEIFSYDSISRLTLVASSNVGAEAIAEAAATRRSMTTAQLLAEAISKLGLMHTTATNSTGLDISATQAGAYGSPRDIARIAGALLQEYPQIASATVQPSLTTKSEDGISHTFPNTNQFVVNTPGIMFSKTGYTDLAGGNLVVIFDAGIGHPVAVVVLGSTESGRFTDVETLIRATQAHFAGVAK
jgi:D-alanyl-D-alanine carboxypeptidase (penicillin-binding protein 5/6)